ncbi:MAG: protease pro-enzyme activation domain-containing protein, partial [Streptosporangiaceae bacterium]
MATAATAGVLLAGGLSGATFLATAAQASTQRSPIAGTRPAWATGRAAAVTKGAVNTRIYLAGRDAAGLTAYATAVSDPASSIYRHYLTPA